MVIVPRLMVMVIAYQGINGNSIGINGDSILRY